MLFKMVQLLSFPAAAIKMLVAGDAKYFVFFTFYNLICFSCGTFNGFASEKRCPISMHFLMKHGRLTLMNALIADYFYASWYEENQSGWIVLLYKRDLSLSSSFEFKLNNAVISSAVISSISILIFYLIIMPKENMKFQIAFHFCYVWIASNWHKHSSNILWHQSLWRKQQL